MASKSRVQATESTGWGSIPRAAALNTWNVGFMSGSGKK